MHHADPRELLVNVVKVLKKLKISHIVTGGIAVLVWGRPRFTADIDIVVELRKKDVPRLHEALHLISASSYMEESAMFDAVASASEFNFIDGLTGVKVDFWVINENDYLDHERIKRKRIKTILGEKIYFTTPEDLMLIKLKWHAKSSSSKQSEDIESIIKISGEKLDWRYLEKMANKLGILKLLKKLKLTNKL